MKEVAYKITLELVVDREQYDSPVSWDWPTLLDINPDQIIASPLAVVIPLPRGKLLKLVKDADEDRQPSDGPT